MDKKPDPAPDSRPPLQPLLIDVGGDGLVCDPETGVCTIPGTKPEPKGQE